MNSTETTGWMPEPKWRGTISLVQSSLLTLWLCVYSALHLNLPSASDGNVRQTVRKTKWILIGIFAPEVVVYVALMQRISARKLTKIVNIRLESVRQHQRRRHVWTLKHSFFAQMGGFVIDTHDAGKPAYIPLSPKLSVTANGLALLAETDHLPDISIESIEDKSTQNLLAKSLALLQATWFLLQIVGRLVEQLPISLLEIHIAAHTLCAFLVYLLWWEKPYDVGDAMILSGKWVRPLTAASWMLSYNDMRKESDGGFTTRKRPPELEGLLYCEFHMINSNNQCFEERPEIGTGGLGSTDPDETLPNTEPSVEIGQSGVRELLAQGNGQSRPDSHAAASLQILNLQNQTVREAELLQHPVSISSGEVLLPFGFGPNAESKTFEIVSVRMPMEGYTPNPYGTGIMTIKRRFRPLSIPVDAILIERWKLALQFFQSQPDIWARFKRTHEQSPHWTVSKHPTALFQPSYLNSRITNFPGKDLIIGLKGVFSATLLACCFSIYGGVHATAWVDYFPTPGARWLWRISAILISSTGLGWAFYLLVSSIPIPLQMERVTSPAFKVVSALLMVVFGLVVNWALQLLVLAYVLARLYLPMMALWSLRELPNGVYQTTSWAQVLQAIPHL